MTAPYSQDQDGDTGIIGPGIHAEAMDGVRLVELLADEILTQLHASGDEDSDDSDAVTDICQRAIALMNLAYAEGRKATP